MKEDNLNFRNGKLMKFLPFIGIPLFFALAFACFISAYALIFNLSSAELLTSLMAILLAASIVLLGGWFLYLTYLGVLLLNFRNIEFEIRENELLISNKGLEKLIPWDQITKLKNSDTHQVFQAFDFNGSRLFIIDHWFPKFEKFKQILEERTKI